MNKTKTVAAILVAGGILAFLWPWPDSSNNVTDPENYVLIATWNVRGYPETEDVRREWFSKALTEISPDILCVQEIANQDRVDTFLANEGDLTTAAFQNSSDGQDNAIFAADWVQLQDIDDPEGFQHPSQAAYVAYKGFDAVILTLHLSWEDLELREIEKQLLVSFVADMLLIDPDVIIVGDFNTTEQGIQELAEAIGMVVMVPPGQDGIGTTDGNNRYDHFLISPDMVNEEAISCEIKTYPDEPIAWEVSDHIPVIALFDPNPKYKDRE